jgi:hypothetical protein
MISKGNASSDISEWSLMGLKKNEFLQYSKDFPKKVQNIANELTAMFGKHIVTLDEKYI